MKTEIKIEKVTRQKIVIDQDELEKILLDHFGIKNGSVDLNINRWLDHVEISGRTVETENVTPEEN
jgi:hypothetical protein